jgi:uncharacterized protein
MMWGLLFDDIATYTKLASMKSTGLVVDDLAAIANFTNETTSDILKKELEKAKTVEEFKHNIEKLDKAAQDKIIEELNNIREIAILEAKRKAAARELPIVYKIALGSFKKQIYHYSCCFTFKLFSSLGYCSYFDFRGSLFSLRRC